MSRIRKLFLSALVLGAVGVVTGVATFSSFSSSTTSVGNSFTAGTVAISDNDGGTAMLSLANAKPGDADTSCITLTYTGTLDSAVHLYGTVSGPLAPYLTLTVTRGTDSAPTFDSCTSFTADTTDYLGQGAGVIYSGALASFPASWAAGIVDPAVGGGNETWSTNEARTYRFSVTLQSSNAAQGLSGSAAFTWEAQNL